MGEVAYLCSGLPVGFPLEHRGLHRLGGLFYVLIRLSEARLFEDCRVSDIERSFHPHKTQFHTACIVPLAERSGNEIYAREWGAAQRPSGRPHLF